MIFFFIKRKALKVYIEKKWSLNKNSMICFRSSGETLSREQFEKRLAAVIAYLYPAFKSYELASEGVSVTDPLQQQLALRERPNRLGILSVRRLQSNYSLISV